VSKPDEWDVKENHYDLVWNINMIHITPWECTAGLLKGSARVLKPGGFLLTYGPYMLNGKITPESNRKFNRKLKKMNSKYGLKDITKIEEEASKYDLPMIKKVKMPVNNYCLIFKKLKKDNTWINH